MTAKRDVEELVRFGGRVAGSEAERRAAGRLDVRLRELGREAVVEPISVFPAWHLTHALHAVLAIAGSVLAIEQPVLGTAVAALALASLVGDATGTFHLVRRLTGRRASQNVVSAEGGDKQGTLVLVAHYDTARTGFVFGRRLPSPALGPLFWSMAAVVACSALRIPGLEGNVLTAIQFVPTVALIVHVPLLVDIALSDPVPGANDNASGVATALRLAERHGGSLEHFDLWLLFTGAEEGFALGMREFLRGRRRELSRTSTVFVNLEELGSGDVRFSRREGPLFTSRSHPQLRKLCYELADDDPDAGAVPLVLRTASDAGAAHARGYPAITITARPAPHHHLPSDTAENLEEDALERSFGFCAELVERLDQELGPDLRQ
jgi:acetylornithine deacetylase/succinyl-diaminopimelate desuccinylase-like protein